MKPLTSEQRDEFLDKAAMMAMQGILSSGNGIPDTDRLNRKQVLADSVYEVAEPSSPNGIGGRQPNVASVRQQS